MDKMNLSNESSEEIYIPSRCIVMPLFSNHLNKEISNVKSDLWTSRRYENSLCIREFDLKLPSRF
ncbi:hypothetical protein T03_16182 [Trichinella britovi]|uniref:Uncharacterized protein n=1 Tax=Trichinella britovi TaxID=45882 RepID=A0A0V1CGY0_TRIBR|nr:hypothetical protein T03_16182 [Trichinella britovi]